MRRIALLTVYLALLAPQVALAQSLKGVWRGTAARTIGGPNDGLTYPLLRYHLLC